MKELPIHERSTAGRSSHERAVAVPADYVPRKRAGVLELDMGDGFVLYNDDASLVHHLNPSAAIVWHLCDGRSTVGELARDIAAEYGLVEPDVRREVGSLVAEFEALDLMHDARAESSSATLAAG
jgi:pyrroloquinoline quinone biosynthesis protein D